jgi:hypothetical protein
MTVAADRLKAFADELKTYRGDRVGFFRNVLCVDPHEGQQEWLTRPPKDESALTTGNRWGKSHVAAGELIYNCAYRPTWDDALREQMVRSFTPYHAINISITSDQAKLVWFKAHGMLQNPKASWLVKDVKMTPFPRITFANGSVLEARSTGGNGDRLLGNVYDAVNWDEAAYEKKFNYIRDNVVRMRLLDRAGTLNYTSTGNGRNEYGRYFLSGLEGREPDLYAQTGSTLQNPNVNRERLDKLLLRMPERMRRQNIQGEIVDAGGGFFEVEDLEAAENQELTDGLVIHSFDDEDQIKHAEVYVGRSPDCETAVDSMPWHNRYPSHRYVHFWDLADKQDFTVGITLDTADKMKLVEFERFRRTGWSHIYERIIDRHRRYQVSSITASGGGQSRTFYDATGVGDAVGDNLTSIRAEGLKFSKPVKDEILAELQSALSTRALEWPMIPVLYDEHKFYEREDQDIVQDCVMSLAGAVHFGKRKRFSGASAI